MKKIKMIFAAMTIMVLAINSPIFTSPAEARQCVWNKAGFVTGVSWFRKGDFANGAIKEGTKPVQVDIFPIGQGKCQRTDEELLAVIACMQCDKINTGVNILASATIGAAGTIACAATAGAGCPAAIPLATIAISALAAGGGQFLPETTSVVYIGTPPNDVWLDVWGTAWDPQTGRGSDRWFDNNDKPTCNPCY